MFGALMGPAGPTADAQPADLENKWLQTLQSPETQRMLLTFGTQLMTPRWSGASALPDAINAVGRGEAAIEQEDYNREKAETDRQTKVDINNADNTAAMARTQVAADSRHELAAARNQTTLERERIRKGLTDPNSYTPQERREAAQLAKEYRERWTQNPANLVKPVPPGLDKEAENYAHDIVVGRRARSMAPGSGGDFISTNPAAPSGQQGQAKPGEAGKITSTNPSNAKGDRRAKVIAGEAEPEDFSDFMAVIESRGQTAAFAKNPQLQAEVRKRIKDPQQLDKWLRLNDHGR